VAGPQERIVVIDERTGVVHRFVDDTVAYLLAPAPTAR
jgi:hypothetical protein